NVQRAESRLRVVAGDRQDTGRESWGDCTAAIGDIASDCPCAIQCPTVYVERSGRTDIASIEKRRACGLRVAARKAQRAALRLDTADVVEVHRAGADGRRSAGARF